jgi:hypothetical protein
VSGPDEGLLFWFEAHRAALALVASIFDGDGTYDDVTAIMGAAPPRDRAAAIAHYAATYAAIFLRDRGDDPGEWARARIAEISALEAKLASLQ